MNTPVIDPIASFLGQWSININIWSILFRILLSVGLAAIIGCERSSKRHSAGLRTFILVSLASTIAMMLDVFIGISETVEFPLISAATIIASAIISVNSVLFSSRNQIKGLTTAAGLWSAAGVGLALGIGFYEAAIAGTLAVFVVMTLLQKLDNKLHRKSKQLEAYIELSTISLGDFLRTMREENVEVSDVQREYGEESDGVRAYVATLKGKKRLSHTELMEKALAIPGVVFVEEL